MGLSCGGLLSSSFKLLFSISITLEANCSLPVPGQCVHIQENILASCHLGPQLNSHCKSIEWLWPNNLCSYSLSQSQLLSMQREQRSSCFLHTIFMGSELSKAMEWWMIYCQENLPKNHSVHYSFLHATFIEYLLCVRPCPSKHTQVPVLIYITPWREKTDTTIK